MRRRFGSPPVYCIDFGGDKKAYIEAFWENFNWAKAEELYLKARAVSF